MDEIKRTAAIQQIEKQLLNLKDKELDHIANVIHILSTSTDTSMHYLGRFLGMEEVDDGIKMSLGLQNENTYSVVQGGALYTLADVAIGYHVLRKLKKDEKVFTLEMKVNFIKKGTGNYLYAKPKILHWGRKTIVADCSILDDDEKLIAQALGTFMVVP